MKFDVKGILKVKRCLCRRTLFLRLERERDARRVQSYPIRISGIQLTRG